MGTCFAWCVTRHFSQSTVVFLVYKYIMVGMESQICLFADDCICYRQIESIEDKLKLQKNNDQLGKWARKWGMIFQPAKCNMMQLSRKQNKEIN